jgi:hypothetical protein
MLIEAVLNLFNGVFVDLSYTQRARTAEIFCATNREEWMC